jgi:lysophospholipase L1-like esterase
MIVFDGDSLTSRRRGGTMETWPYLRLMNWRRTYYEEVADWLFCIRPDLKLRFLNVGIGGSCCRNLPERLESRVLPARPDWVVMTIGGNDARREIPIREFRRTLTDYAGRVADTCGGKMAFVGGFRACPNLPEGLSGKYSRRAAYYRVQREIADKTGGLYVDAGRGLQARARMLYRQSPIHTVYSDGGHFNTIGNRIIAAELLDAFGVQRRLP